MFHDIPDTVRERMRVLEEIDACDRTDGTPRQQRLRQIPSETGRFLALLAAMAPQGQYLELGTSAGYSSLWLGLACKALGRTLTTFEISEEKARLAQETLQVAAMDDVIELVVGDAREHLKELSDVAFCFLDAEKEIYQECYDMVIPNMVPGGTFVADNAINHRDTLQAMLNRALADDRVDAVIVPIGKGELVCRRI